MNTLGIIIIALLVGYSAGRNKNMDYFFKRKGLKKYLPTLSKKKKIILVQETEILNLKEQMSKLNEEDLEVEEMKPFTTSKLKTK